MNLTPEERQLHANRCLTSAFDTLTKVCPILKQDFKLAERDDEKMEFSIDGIPFAIFWNESDKKSLGGMVTAVEFILYTFHTTWGSRWHPPEVIDTEVISSESIHICLRAALKKVFEVQMDNALENVGTSTLIDAEREFGED